MEWMDKEEYNDFKNELKILVPSANLKRNKQDYAMGGFNINPTKKNDYKFSIEETDKIMQWLVDNDLWVLDMSAKEYRNVICSGDNKTILYQLSGENGFRFIQKYKEVQK